MKKSLIALSLLAALGLNAKADTVLVATNKAGGTINLMDNTSVACSKQGAGYLVAYSTNADQNVAPLRGCWKPIDRNAHVLWADGNERMFPLGSFEPTDYAERAYDWSGAKSRSHSAL